VLQVSSPDGNGGSDQSATFGEERWYEFARGNGGDNITLDKEVCRTAYISQKERCKEEKRADMKPVTISGRGGAAAPAFLE
jgi:hypothetical protein